MKIKGNYDVNNYGIQGFRQASSNGGVLDMNKIIYTPMYEELKEGFVSKKYMNKMTMVYGNGQTFDFDKNRTYELLLSILGEDKLVNKMKITKPILEKLCEGYGLENVLNGTLKGEAVVVVTAKNASNVVGITHLDKNGELCAKDTSNLFLANPQEKEMGEE